MQFHLVFATHQHISRRQAKLSEYEFATQNDNQARLFWISDLRRLCCCFSSLFGINLFRVNFICIHRPQKSQNSAQLNTQCPNECAQNIECEQNGRTLCRRFLPLLFELCVCGECCAKTEKGHALTRSPFVIHILQVACGLWLMSLWSWFNLLLRLIIFENNLKCFGFSSCYNFKTTHYVLRAPMSLFNNCATPQSYRSNCNYLLLIF